MICGNGSRPFLVACGLLLAFSAASYSQPWYVYPEDEPELLPGWHLIHESVLTLLDEISIQQERQLTELESELTKAENELSTAKDLLETSKRALLRLEVSFDALETELSLRIRQRNLAMGTSGVLVVALLVAVLR